MVARAGGYYGTVFKGEGGVTQGDPLSPTIFNMVVDTVVLCHTSFPFKHRAVITPRSGHHGQAASVGIQQPPGVRDNAAALQDLQAPGPVQSVVHFIQVQEDHVEDLLPHGRKLLKQLGLEGGGFRAATFPEAMEGVVGGDGGCETAI